MKNILVTGGAGYIGSHTCLELLDAGYEVTVVDNLSNSKEVALERVKQISGRSLTFYKVDLLDKEALEAIFREKDYQAVIHFAGKKAPAESIDIPMEYYWNNITGTLNLCKLMAKYQVYNLVFSSSAAVYSEKAKVPFREDAPCGPINPYGRTKWMIEMILKDLFVSDQEWRIILLRYFNPVGAHPSGKIGEDPHGIPINLLPFITQVAVGKLPELGVYGNDYPTPDGTCIRDYIHVVDLAKGHTKALEKINDLTAVETYNLGTNRGYSVMEVVAAFEQATGKKIPYRIVGRRPGDMAVSYADINKANQELGWYSLKGLMDICTDAWRWQSQNPKGYD
jgi:UDP-glucose 4-epimerase